MRSASSQSLTGVLWWRTALLLFLTLSSSAPGQDIDTVKAAQAYRKGNQPVTSLSDTTIIAEAEEFQVKTPGWQAKRWGENYFCATFANAFLSRKAFLGAPEQCEPSIATIDVEVPKAGRYLALVRYESCYRFETQFRLQVEQKGKKLLDRLYGARANLKIWAFREKLKKEVVWPWGAGENIVWEGHDAYVELQSGKATLSLIAGKQPVRAAKRNVDLVMLTSDEKQVKQRIDKENYLPLDGMLTQEGDLYLSVQAAKNGPAMTLTIPNGIEHSPYWVHLRHWKPKTIKVPSGQKSPWVEVGSLLDSLNDGQWTLTATSEEKARAPVYQLHFAVKTAEGKLETIKTFDFVSGGKVTFAYDADTRYTRRIRLADEVLYDLVAYLKKQPVQGVAPKRTLIYGYTFSPKAGDAKYNAALNEFINLIGATALGRETVEEVNEGGLIRGYIDVRGVPTDKLEEYCKKLQAQGKANQIAVVSLGDEIGLPGPPANDHSGFRNWLKGRGIKPAAVDAAAGDSYEKLTYNPSAEAAKARPGLYYYSKLYGYRFGIAEMKKRTDILRKYLPRAGIGANFSPHQGHMYLGETHHWISLFREEGMTMPWGEDYIFQVPMGSQQVNAIMVDMFRAASRNKPAAKIHYYVMAHTPNNTLKSWRRQFYADLAHGVKVFNLFEFRPVQAAYTENHVNAPAMYQEVRKGLHELGRFEDIIQDGAVRQGVAALWFSETGDIWDDNQSPFDAAKRALYLALRHQQLPLDVVVEGDDLKGYQLLYLADAHVSQVASQAIAEWVKGGGRLFATAGAGMFDERNQPNKVLRDLFGVEQKSLENSKDEPVRFEKQDLPFAKEWDTVTMNRPGFSKALKIPVISLRSRVTLNGAELHGTFKDLAPAVTMKKSGKGWALYCAFLPGLSYLKPAFPERPMDRGATDDSMTHFLPTRFDEGSTALFQWFARDVTRPVVCSDRLVESTMVQAKQGVVIPLINWQPEAVKGLTVTVNPPVPTKSVTLASGRPVQVHRQKGALVVTLDLDVADALILR
jgi:hypothetical protein